jgi:hypothetical protein
MENDGTAGTWFFPAKPSGNKESPRISSIVVHDFYLEGKLKQCWLHSQL